MAQEPFIVCDNLVKIYKVAGLETVALQGLDLVVMPGELLGMVGASGSGKSTLMNILGGLDRPSAGRVWVSGQDLLKISDADLNAYRQSQVGFVWQQSARNLIPYLNAQENIQLPLTLAGETGKKAAEWALHLLEIVGLSDRRHHHLSELSGGEQQRVSIAVALANQPKLLLADEPTGEVDSETALKIYETFQNLNHTLHVTTVIVSHDPTIARHVDRVIAIRDGRLAAETVRQGREKRAANPHNDSFEELTVLDSAGRLQVPKEFLAHFGIKGRVQLELTDEGILIRPAAGTDHAEAAESRVDDLARSHSARGLRGLLQRWRGETVDD